MQNQQSENKVSKEWLLAFRDNQLSIQNYNSTRFERISMLMRRNSAKKWKLAKKQKMVRRLVAAEEASKQAQAMIDQVDVELGNV